MLKKVKKGKKDKKRKLGDAPSLTDAQIGILASLGMELKETSDSSPKKRKSLVDKKKKPCPVNDATWDKMLQEITTFKGKIGHTISPHSKPQLREWVQSAQIEYTKFTAGVTSALTTERVQALNAIRFQFDSM